MPVSLDLRSAA
ncbi:hypothetical protein D047_0407A, partial [Vibrio parahaemolyticus VPTS-2010_2]